MSNAEHVTPTRSLEWDELWAAMEAEPDTWHPTTEAQWWHMLEAVPPKRFGHAAFLTGEPAGHNAYGIPVYAAFRRDSHGRPLAKYMTAEQFDRGPTQ